MFRLIRWLISFVLFIALVWAAFTIPLGKKTLIEHLHSIAASKEGRELVEGVKEKAVQTLERLQQDAASPADGSLTTDGAPADGGITDGPRSRRHRPQKKNAPPLRHGRAGVIVR
jgi:hypothetical protein